LPTDRIVLVNSSTETTFSLSLDRILAPSSSNLMKKFSLILRQNHVIINVSNQQQEIRLGATSSTLGYAVLRIDLKIS
jgi:hypothetical protein